MKKIGLLLLSSILFFGFSTFASNTCRQVEFTNGRVCVDITKESSNAFKLKTNVEKGNEPLWCAVYYLTTNTSKEISNCNGEFFVNNPIEQQIKLYIKIGKNLPTDRDGKPNNKQEWVFPLRYYDFNIGERSYPLGDDKPNNSRDVDSFSISSNSSYPKTNERIDLSIKALNRNNNTVTDYRSSVEFNVYYRTSSSSSWRAASSSDYEFRTISSNRYSFSSSDRGEAILNRELRFKRDYDFKVEVIDRSDNRIKGEKIFYLEDYLYNNGFSSTELNRIKAVYNSRNEVIKEFKRTYKDLRTNTRWLERSDELKQEMKKIIDDSPYKKYSTYKSFITEFSDRLTYTSRYK